MDHVWDMHFIQKTLLDIYWKFFLKIVTYNSL